MIERLSPAKRNLVLLGLGILLVWFCWTIRSVLNPLLLGYLFAFILQPFVRRMEGLGFSRRTAVNLTFVGGFVLSGLVLLGLALQVRSLAIEVYRSAKAEAVQVESGEGSEEPSLQQKLQGRIDEFTATLNDWGMDVGPWTVPDLAGFRELAEEFLQEHGEELSAAAGAGIQAAGKGFRFLTRFVGGIVSIAGLFVLVPLYTYYFLFVAGRTNEFVKGYLPKRDRERIAGVAEKIGQVVASFFRGRLAVCFLKGLFLAIGLSIAGVPYAFLFGMLSGFLSIIPFFGPFLGFLLAFVVGMTEHGLISSLFRTGIVFLSGEALEGYVLLPKILGDSLGLHPLVVFVALLAGGAAMGMLGILIALPLAASFVILAQEFVLPALRDLAET